MFDVKYNYKGKIMRTDSIKTNPTPFNGELNIKNIRNRISKEDFQEILTLRKRIAKEPYDITLGTDSFGKINTQIKHENGNEVNLRRISIANTIGAIPEYIEKIMDLININKVK